VVVQFVLIMVGLVDQVMDRVRRRACCPNPACPVKSWTVYEEGGYPHRTFTLEVAASGVAQLAADEEATLQAVAEKHRCDRRTVGRWVAWMVRLCAAATLVQACARLDPSGAPPPRAHRKEGARFRAGWILLLLDHLARLLRDRGVSIEAGSGFAAILRAQFVRLGTVVWLTKYSPPLRIGWGAWVG